MVKSGRIKEEFSRLVMIDSPSRREKKLADYLARRFRDLGGQVAFDEAGSVFGGDCGNLLVRLPGNCEQCLPLMFNAHLDTVKSRPQEPPLFEQGVFRSDGDAILGADDKSGIAVILEMVRVLQEDRLPHGDLELVFTVAEEAGLLGAKNLDYDWLRAKVAFSLDGGAPSDIVRAAPASNRMKYKLYGLAAHAGVHPEDGISVIQIASRAIERIPLGRVDTMTTANIGVIRGGQATNIIPDYLEISAEARSHDPARLRAQTETMSRAFREAVRRFSRPGIQGLPRFEEQVRLEYPLMNVAEESLSIKLVQKAGASLGRSFNLVRSGGGSDANIFNSRGIETIILGTGMHNPHTSAEIVALDDMAACAELLVQIASG